MNKKVLDYVKNYFDSKFSIYRLGLKDNEYDELIYYVSSVVNDKYRDKFELVRLGEANDLISSQVMNYLRNKLPEFKANCINLKNYIKKYIYDSHFVNCSIKTVDFIAERMLIKFIFSYNYFDLNNGKYDGKINLYYDMIVKNLPEEIIDYVVHYIALNVSPLTDIDEMVVANQIVDLIMKTNKFNIISLFAGDYGKNIEELAEKNKKDNKSKRFETMPDTYKYIRNKIASNTSNVDLVNKIVDKIDIELRGRGLTSNEIVSGKYDVDINALYSEYYFEGLNLNMLDMSIEKDNVPSEIKKNGKKVDISKTIASILVLSVLSTASFYMVGKEIRNRYAKDNLSKIDNYSYYSVDSIYDHDFESTASNILNTYNDYSSFGNSNFNYLGFYRAFVSSSHGKNVTDDDRFYVMDKMLYEIKDTITNDFNYAELKSVLKVNSCYLDFIYDRLYEMGYTEIKDDKYIELLQSYVKEKNENPYRDPVESLSNSQVRLLNEVSKKYMELSEQYLVELGVLLGSNSYSETSTTGRGHSI